MSPLMTDYLSKVDTFKHFLTPYSEKAVNEYQKFFSGDENHSRTIMEVQGDIEGVLEALKRPKTGDVIGIVSPGAGQGCAIMAGYYQAFEEKKILDNFSNKSDAKIAIVATSSGWAGPGYWGSGNVTSGASIITEENCVHKLFNPFRIGYPYPFALDNLMDDLQFSHKAFNVDRYLKKNMDMWIAVTHADPQKAGIRIDTQKKNTSYSLEKAGTFIKLNRGNAFPLIKATMCIPELYRGEAVIEGKEYIDGSLWGGLGIEWMIERIKPTHLLVLSGKPLKLSTTVDSSEPITSDFGSLSSIARILRDPNSRYLKALTDRNTRQMQREVKSLHKLIQKPKCKTAVIQPIETPITPWTMNSDVLKDGMQQAYKFMLQLL